MDALDECTDGSELLDWIKEITSWKAGRLHILATSREDVDIKIGLMKLSPASICLGGDSVNADIATYLDSKLLPDPARKTWRDYADTRNEVLTDGQFNSVVAATIGGGFRLEALNVGRSSTSASVRPVDSRISLASSSNPFVFAVTYAKGSAVIE
jgi:hypothetical protein